MNKVRRALRENQLQYVVNYVIGGAHLAFLPVWKSEGYESNGFYDYEKTWIDCCWLIAPQ